MNEQIEIKVNISNNKYIYKQEIYENGDKYLGFFLKGLRNSKLQCIIIKIMNIEEVDMKVNGKMG